jgi:hypothetical protein
VLAGQTDAVLAGTIALVGIFRNVIIEELLIDRYRPRLILSSPAGSFESSGAQNSIMKGFQHGIS